MLNFVKMDELETVLSEDHRVIDIVAKIGEKIYTSLGISLMSIVVPCVLQLTFIVEWVFCSINVDLSEYCGRPCVRNYAIQEINAADKH